MTHGLKKESIKLALHTGLALLFGLAIGHPITCLLAGGCVYLYLSYRKVRALFQWINSKATYPPAELEGFWGEIASAIYKDRRKLNKIQAIQQQELQRVNKIASSMVDGIVLLKENSILDWWNPQAEAMLKLEAKDRFVPLLHRVRHPDFQQYFNQGDFSKPCTINLTHSMQSVFEIHVTPVTPELGETLVVFRDVSALKRLEQMRKDFVGNISHELRTPLTVINGYLDMMDGMLDPAQWGKMLGQMRNQSDRMTALSADLSMLSKLEEDNYRPKREPVVLNSLIHTIIDDARHLSTKHALHFNDGEQVSMQGDYQQLYSAISNLVVNAIRHNPDGCDVTVDLTTTDDGIQVRVEDNGKGIAKHHLPRLTERFYRTDNDRNSSTGGTGLGLAIVKHVLQHHDGHLDIWSEEGVGTRFVIAFG